MTNTDTRDVNSTLKQIYNMTEHGCELVRLAVLNMEAAEKIYRILQAVSCVPVTELTDRQKKLLMTCFKGIQSDDINVRYNEWLKRIHSNYFEIADFNDGDETVEYSTGTILNDINFRGQFYSELNDHFDWVRGDWSLTRPSGVYSLCTDVSSAGCST